MAQQTCLDYALHYISRYPKTESELKIKLMQKGYFSNDIEKAMNILKEKKFLSDELFVESYVRSELMNKGKPPIAIIKKLQEKGADKHLIMKIIKQNEEDVNSGVRERIKKEIASYKKRGEEGFDIIQKLMRKGYRLGDIKDVINNK
ncbi:Regulatory protein RecX [candidate division SR1 bacterium RAAC1_SR1_1]|nr:Regulatory protein RecX [candidate division SR1 bacterium RAAC1_SR1_1]